MEEDYATEMERRYAHVRGSVVKEYFSNSPWATITRYEVGFLVTNVVTGSVSSHKTWDEATGVRQMIASRYASISRDAGW